MIVSLDGDEGGEIRRRLENMGHLVLTPFGHGHDWGNCDAALAACFKLAWYLMTARSIEGHKSSPRVSQPTFVCGSPTTVELVEDGLPPTAAPNLKAAYYKLLGMLHTEFKPVAYVLVQNAPKQRALHRNVTTHAARQINSRYWSMYRALSARGAKAMIL